MIARLVTPIDVGCEPTNFLGHIVVSDITWHGFEPKPTMVGEGRRVAARLHRTGSHARLGSVLDHHALAPMREKVDRKDLLTATRAMGEPHGWQGMVMPSTPMGVKGRTS